MKVTRLFLAPRFGARPDVRLIDPERRSAAGTELLFRALPADYRQDISLVESVEEADFVLIPQLLRTVDDKVRAYLRSVVVSANGKSVLVFLGGDLGFKLHIDMPGILVFKVSEYESGRHANEIIYPPFVEDLGSQRVFMSRSKGLKPTVSFCGFAGLPSSSARLRFYTKNAMLDLASLCTGNPALRAHKRGIYFRRAAMKQLSADDRIETNFIVRTTFSGNAATTKRPEMVRAEYLDSIDTADLVLCPKGDGNFSARMYETLSAGRIPLILDTDMRLPLEGVLDYERFSLRIPHTELGRISDRVIDFWSRLTNESYAAMQEEARKTFVSSLRFDSYFNIALPRLAEEGVASVL